MNKKVIIIGSNNTGKTSYLKNIINHSFSEIRSPTFGSFCCNYTTSLYKNITTVDIWKLPTINEHDKINKFLCQNTDGLFLFFDITNKHSLSILRKKIKTIVKSVGNTVPIVVIANKSDLIESRETSDKKIQVFLDKLNELNSYVQFFETSNKTKQNVNESFKWLLNQMNDSAK